MNRNFIVDNYKENGKYTKVHWETSLGPSSPNRVSRKKNKPLSEKGDKRSLGSSPYCNSVNFISNTQIELPKKISVIKIRKLKTREYSLPIVANSKVFTTTKTKVFSMGLQSPKQGFQVHKYFIPRRLANPGQFFFKNLNIRENSGQTKDISMLISKNVKRRTKLSATIRNLQ